MKVTEVRKKCLESFNNSNKGKEGLSKCEQGRRVQRKRGTLAVPQKVKEEQKME